MTVATIYNYSSTMIAISAKVFLLCYVTSYSIQTEQSLLRVRIFPIALNTKVQLLNWFESFAGKLSMCALV